MSSSSRTLRPRGANGDLTPSTLQTDEDFDEKPNKQRSKSKSKSSTKRKEKTEVSSSLSSSKKKKKRDVIDTQCRFVGEPIPEAEARKRWPERYDYTKAIKGKSRNCSSNQNVDDEEEVLFARCHYTQAEVDECIFNLGDDTYVKGAEENDYIGRIVEFFETTDNRAFFTAQWFFKAEDTVIQDNAGLIDTRRVFFSDLKNDNPLDCIISKIKIVKVSPNVDLVAKSDTLPPCDLYYDMKYSLSYSTFSNLPKEISRDETSSTISSDSISNGAMGETKASFEHASLIKKHEKSEMTLLDLYSGCGGMSTGLCMGASASSVNLVTRWAVDFNKYACQSLKWNHPETEVRNEKADDFLSLLKEWEKLCNKFSLMRNKHSRTLKSYLTNNEDGEEEDYGPKASSGEFEVGKLVGICYGDPNNVKNVGLYFKVRWKGYGPSEDTWEPMNGLAKCKERIQEFVTRGYESNILPLPGDVDVICGGPPCQGISGFNRFRNKDKPLDDPKNHQLVVFMDIVEYLKPKYVLMENVVDILKFSGGFLGRYAIGRLVSLNYQARLGMMVAGCYGLPQFRVRVFLWGAHPSERLPQYPLPTHEVVIRGGTPNEFQRNVVAYDENHPFELEKALRLGDAISDLPPVTNFESRDEMPYEKAAQTEFQKFITSSKTEFVGCKTFSQKPTAEALLFDHCPLQLNTDDYDRVCRVPKKKGANFRDFPGVLVRPDNKVEWDQSIERVYLQSGKPLVPDYAMSFQDGASTKPFGRLWWDETVSTVVTRAEPHNQVIMHPNQDRVLSVRENARLQGFPDYYKLCGPVKERYIQVGNAVAVPVARALGYALGLAYEGTCSDEPLLTLPPKFSSLVVEHSSSIDIDDADSLE